MNSEEMLEHEADAAREALTRDLGQLDTKARNAGRTLDRATRGLRPVLLGLVGALAAIVALALLRRTAGGVMRLARGMAS